MKQSNLVMHQQRGLSLIELMVSMAMGIFMISVSLQFLVGSRQSSNNQETSMLIQENARFAMDFLSSNVHMAGYSDDTTILPNFFFTGDCGGYSPCTGDNTSAGSDSIAVEFITPDGEDCLGDAVAVGQRIANVFWVAEDTDRGVSSLYCRGFSVNADGTTGSWIANSQPLIDGVENMQIQYGITDGDNDGVVSYVPASGVADWTTIRSVRLMLLVGTGLETGLATDDSEFTASASYQLLDADEIKYTDGRTRAVFSTTAVINNAL